jgi:hypothetical protein
MSKDPLDHFTSLLHAQACLPGAAKYAQGIGKSLIIQQPAPAAAR